MALRLWFFGSGAIGVPTLQALASSHAVLGVATRPERPQGRGQVKTPTPVSQAAQALGLSIVEPPSSRDPQLLTNVRTTSPDALVVFAYGGILPQTLLDIPQHGALNIHPSLLPRYRGAAPVPWALLHGDRETGITIFKMDAQIDHGPILLQERVPIRPDDTAATLTERVSRLAPPLLLTVLAQIERGTVSWTPQDDRDATPAPRLTKADGWIDWTLGAQLIIRRNRALTPWPGTMTSWQGHALKLIRIDLHEPAGVAPGASPGTILRADPAGIVVQTGEGAVRILELQLAGGRPLDASVFLRGHPMRPGEQFGPGEKS